MNGPLVTVVTPVYNGAAHLTECIESVLAQTYRNWQYVVVDNCSNDATSEIAARFAILDSRIRVVRNESFVRVIANYNNAVRECSPASKYCKVLAADDWLFPECLERMVQFAEAHPEVGLVGAYQLGTGGTAWPGPPYNVSVLSGREACRRELLGGPYIFGTPTTLLMRADLVRARNPFYNESNIHADTEACLDVLGQTDFGFVHQILTFNRREPGSLTSFSERTYTYLPSFLYLLDRYGPRYLTPEELSARRRLHLRDYYRALAGAFLKRRGREFWDYHRTKLRELGYPMSTRRLVMAIMSRAVGLALNPKAALEGVSAPWRNRNGAIGAA
jgi:glycosyltransferase involved in cell wall biosynthesis